MDNLFNLLELKTVLGNDVYGITEVNVTEVVINSREASKGSLFVPLKGETTDGNLYIEGALKGGCNCSLVSKEYYNNNNDTISRLLREYKCCLIIVEDGLEALHALARFHMSRFPGLKVVGITGSSGKTSTKEVMGSILNAYRNTLVTEGNYNSETGLPLTVFRINSDHEYAVLEMGMSKPGEIQALVDIVNPDISIITNIGRAHIGFLGTVDGIAKEKKDIFANFTGSNIGIIPSWDKYHDFLKAGVNGRIISVSEAPLYITGVKDLAFDGWEFFYEKSKVVYPYIGRYNLLNAFVAIACARELEIPVEAVVKGLENVLTLFGRGEVLTGKNKVIRDCYNANPDSVKSSLKLLQNTEWSGEKVAVLGSMLELGDSSEDEHRSIAEHAVKSGFDLVILIGNEYEEVYKNIKEKTGILFYKNTEALKDAVGNLIKPDSLVLLKASRGVRLEELTESIL